MRRIVVQLLIASLMLAAFSAKSEEWRFNDVERVVAIADVHGAYDAMVETLQSAGILADDLSWFGGAAHLVIVGDILDRGPKSRAAMDLLMRLEGEATAAGGRVHFVFGNHESMLLTGDLRYVSAEEYAAFAHEEDAVERAKWFELYAARTGGDVAAMQAKFDERFPQGYFAMRRAFRADGRYGRWLLSKNSIVVINGTAFVHGGLAPIVAEVGLEGVNGQLQDELVQYVETLGVLTDAHVLLPTDSHYQYGNLLNGFLPGLEEDTATIKAVEDGKRLRNSALIGTDGPLWYRNNVLCPGIVEEHKLEAALAAIGARRVVIGHTPTANRLVAQKFGGRVIEIDTGMLNFIYKGTGHALVLQGDSVSVTSQAGDTSLVPLDHPREVGDRPAGMTADQLQDFLASNEIVSVEKIADRTMVKLSDGTTTLSAIFNRSRGRGFFPNVAAYRLDRLLNLEMVPVSVRREVEGRDGSLQFWPDNMTNEADRSAAGQGGDAWCSIAEQWPAMYVFDVLVFNEGRSQQRMLYDTSSWRLILSEHERAFPARKGRPGHLRNAPITVNQGWIDALTELDDAVLQDNLGDVLDRRRLKALQLRRDQLLTN